MTLRLLPIAALLAAVTATAQEPAPETAQQTEPAWLAYPGTADRPGSGKRVVLIAADQEYRSEEAMPMLAKVLATHHGFDCTVLFGVDADGRVDPTQKIRWDDASVVHHIPGLDQLADADLLIVFTRLLTLPDDEVRHIVDYLDSGRPVIGIRTANHGFLGNFPYTIDGKPVRFGEDVLGGSFRSHHGGWHREATRGQLVDAARDHPILRGVDDLWGPSDVYRTYPEGGALPEGCTALVLGQPLVNREPDGAPNLDKEALPIAWTKTWTGSTGATARVFHTTMGSARDFECEDLRRMTVNAAYWCLGMEDAIRPDAPMDTVGAYRPRASGFDYPKLDVAPRPMSAFR